MSLRTTPWRHQREAVDFVHDLRSRGKHGAMIAAVMGTGKSAMTVYLCDEAGFHLILVLCPLRVVQVWRPQFEAHSALPFTVVSRSAGRDDVRYDIVSDHGEVSLDVCADRIRGYNSGTVAEA